MRNAGRRIFYVGGVSTVSAIRHARYDIARTVTVFGPARGGTTWLQELLSSGPGTCPIFEPTWSDRAMRSVGPGDKLAVPVGSSAPELEALLRKVMRGQRVTSWSLQLASVPRFLRAERFVVKHVHLNFSAGWVGETFPDSPMVVLVRHPCAVIESLLNVGWLDSTLEAILARRPPDQARRAMELLDGRTSAAAVYASLWALGVGALLHDTDPDRTHLVAYESAVADPAGVVGPLMEGVGLPRPPGLAQQASRPSRMASAGSSTRHAGDPVTAWVDRLDPRDRADVLDVVRRSGLRGYADDPCPDLDALAEEHRRPAGP